MERTICIGDIHGTLIELNELLDKLVYNPDKDRVILCGDVVDRGLYSIQTLRRATELQLECVRGNHEERLLKWLSGDRKVKFQDYYEKLTDADIDYITKMPYYIDLGHTVIIHAGLKPNLIISQQRKDDLTYLRYTDSNGKFVSLKKINKYGIQATGAHFWTEYYKGSQNVVYGHQVHSLTDPLIEETSPNVFCYGLDTGCCFGGRLTALILETKEIVQVQAKQIYFKGWL